MTKRILVFPCGSEVGLEVHRSLRYSSHFELIGGSSVDDHGRFVYEKYLGDLPFHDHPDFIKKISEVIKKYKIDAIYPVMDAVAETLNKSGTIECVIIGSDARVTAICASKTATYDLFAQSVSIPRLYDSLDDVEKYPIFIKPDRGYGSRNTKLACSYEEASFFLKKNANQKMLKLEYLPGREWTIDCFSDRNGKLHFSEARGRNRISNGISVNTSPSSDFKELYLEWAEKINSILKPRGSWFYQVKLDVLGQPRLLEVAARLGGSSGVFRCKGVNFVLLTVFDAFDEDVFVETNEYDIELDRALDNKYKINISYSYVFVDLLDCILVRGFLNYCLIGFLFKAVSEGKYIVLLASDYEFAKKTLNNYRLSGLFDKIMCFANERDKFYYINQSESIFIGASNNVKNRLLIKHNVLVFSPDMVEALM